MEKRFNAFKLLKNRAKAEVIGRPKEKKWIAIECEGKEREVG